MPYAPHDSAYDPSNELPQHLEHRPVYALPYEAFDGQYASETDMRFISIGVAQYDPDEVSIKTMRFVQRVGKWTRQAEELPLHRPIDMTLFLAKVLFDAQNGAVILPAHTFKNQNTELTITPEDRTFGENATYRAAVDSYRADLRERLNALRDCLNDLKERGMI